MICRLIDFALVILLLLVFKVCRIIGISEIEFFNFSSNDRVKQNKKKLKTIRNKSINFQAISTKSKQFFGFSLKI